MHANKIILMPAAAGCVHHCSHHHFTESNSGVLPDIPPGATTRMTWLYSSDTIKSKPARNMAAVAVCFWARCSGVSKCLE